MNFVNTPATLISAGVPGGSSAIGTPAGTYYFALLIAAPGITDKSQFVFTGLYATNFGFGRINGGSAVPVPGWIPGTEKSFMVFGWPANEGATFNYGWLSGQPWLREFGMSMIGTGTAGGTDSNGQVLPPLLLFGSAGFGSPISVGFNIGLECLSCNPPQIMTQPQSRSATEGMNIQFSVSAALTPQLSCQWFCNGSPISGATNFILDLTNVAMSQNGNVYYAVVSNPWGVATSSTVTLNVAPSVRLVPGLLLSGPSGVGLDILQSDLLGGGASWLTRQSFLLNGAPQWFFDLSGSASQRFYRALQNPGAGSGPALELHWVPAILLTGTVGSQIEVDYLQQSGSPNQWSAIATVELTNVAQYFFDTGAVGQPPRSYRLIPK